MYSKGVGTRDSNSGKRREYLSRTNLWIMTKCKQYNSIQIKLEQMKHMFKSEHVHLNFSHVFRLYVQQQCRSQHINLDKNSCIQMTR